MFDSLAIVVKVTDQCNLSCPYCYYYAGEFSSLRQRRFKDAGLRLRRLVEDLSGSRSLSLYRSVTLIIHGGEPLLLPKEILAAFIDAAGARVPNLSSVAMQTNGVLLDKGWLDLIITRKVRTSISLDGPKRIHDRTRPFANGEGSYDKAVRGLRLLQSAEATASLGDPGVLAVFDPEVAGKTYFDHFIRDLGVRRFDLLFPDHLFSTNKEAVVAYEAAIADLWSSWVNYDNPAVRIRTISDAFEAVLARKPAMLGPGQHRVVLDLAGRAFKEDGMRAFSSTTELDLGDWRGNVDSVLEAVRNHAIDSELVPEGCEKCTFLRECGGGDFPYRNILPSGGYGRSPLCNSYMFSLNKAQTMLKYLGYFADA